MVLARDVIFTEDGNYTLKLESTAMGTSALNLFSDHGCVVLIETMHTILASCPTKLVRNDYSTKIIEIVVTFI